MEKTDTMSYNPRPSYGRGNSGGYAADNQRRPNPSSGPSGECAIEKILEKIGRLKNLEDLSVEEIAREDGIAECLVKNKNFRDNLKPTQLRRFFDSLMANRERLAEQGWSAIESDFYMIRPNLAYAQGRKLVPREFFQLIQACLQKIPSPDEEQAKKNYNRFIDLMQALVAYHKYWENRGGR